jgi:hypothetical protein
MVEFCSWRCYGRPWQVQLANERRDLLIAAAVFGIIGAVLIALTPANREASG